MSYPPGPEHGATDAGATDSGAAVSPPRCYRHPGRETYVSCVRIQRHAYPDCLRSPGVWQEWVDCVRDGNRGTRQATGRFGGQVTDRRGVTYTLVALCVIVYIAELVYGK